MVGGLSGGFFSTEAFLWVSEDVMCGCGVGILHQRDSYFLLPAVSTEIQVSLYYETADQNGEEREMNC